MSIKDTAKTAIYTAKIVGTIAGSVAGQPQTPVEQYGNMQKTKNTQQELRVTKTPSTSGSK